MWDAFGKLKIFFFYSLVGRLFCIKQTFSLIKNEKKLIFFFLKIEIFFFFTGAAFQTNGNCKQLQPGTIKATQTWETTVESVCYVKSSTFSGKIKIIKNKTTDSYHPMSFVSKKRIK